MEQPEVGPNLSSERDERTEDKLRHLSTIIDLALDLPRGCFCLCDAHAGYLGTDRSIVRVHLQNLIIGLRSRYVSPSFLSGFCHAGLLSRQTVPVFIGGRLFFLVLAPLGYFSFLISCVWIS